MKLMLSMKEKLYVICHFNNVGKQYESITLEVSHKQ